MIRRSYIFIIVLLALMAMGCERLPLYDEANNLVLEIDIDLDLEMEGPQPAPATMMASFFQNETHKRIYNEFTGPTGDELFVDPGSYHLLCYNFNSGSTHIRQEETYHMIEAYTNAVRLDERYTFDALKRTLIEMGRGNRGYLDEPMVYEPDHLYVAHVEGADVPIRYEGEDKVVIHADATTMLQTWSVEIGYIDHPEWVQTATVYITGQVPSRLLANREATGEPSTIYFTLYEAGARRDRQDIMQSTFRTFGRYPGDDNSVFLVLDIKSTSGAHTMWEWNVSNQMQGDNRYIIIHDEIKVPTPTSGEGGGFDPVVFAWGENIIDIEL